MIIGRREEKDTGVLGAQGGAEGEVLVGGEGEGLLGSAGGEEEILLDEGVESVLKGSASREGRRRSDSYDEDEDDILDLGLERVKSEDEDLIR